MTRFEVFAIVFCIGLFLLGFAFGMVTWYQFTSQPPWYQFTSQPPYTNDAPLIFEFIALVPFSIGLIGLVYYKAFPKENKRNKNDKC
jgi:hypothetical protein